MFSSFWLLLPFVTSAVTTVVIEKTCVKLGILDLPGERKMQKVPVPRMGGLAIYLTCLIFGVALSIHVPKHLFWGATFVFVGGLCDDLGLINSVGAKLMFQIPAALVFVLGTDFSALHLTGFYSYFIPFAIFCLVFFMTNASNLMDNMNGLAAGLSLVIIGSITLISWICNLDISLTLLGILVFVSILGFGTRNFPFGKIYMGDQGSQLLGFFSTTFAISIWLSLYHKQLIGTLWQGVFLLILLFLLYFVDVITVVTIRLREGRSPFIGDQCHLSHQLIRRGFSPTQAVLILIGINTGVAFFAYFLLAS